MKREVKTSSESIISDIASDPRLDSSFGGFHFDPILLMQGRAGDVSFGGASPSVFHERCHWLQFTGTSFGATYMILLHSEDANLKEMYRVLASDDKFRTYVRERLSLGQSVIPLDRLIADPGFAEHLPEGVGRYAQRILMARLTRRLLFDPTGLWPIFARIDTDSLLDGAIELISRSYQALTVKWRDYTDPDIPALGLPRPRAQLYAGREVTTNHLVETGAFIAEHFNIWRFAWDADDCLFKGLPKRNLFSLSDALRDATDKYSWCIDIARLAWRGILPELGDDAASEFTLLAPSIACCIDLALNPCLPPTTAWYPQSWEDMYPPSRFIRLVQCVAAVGLLDRWSPQGLEMEDHFNQYRQRLLQEARLTCPVFKEMSGSSRQLSGDLLTSGSPADPRIAQMTQFDFVVWAIETLRRLRNDHPLVLAVPPMIFSGGVWGDLFAANDDVAVAAPLYNADAPWSYNGRLDVSVASKIITEVCSSWMLQQISFRSGRTSLRDALGYNFKQLDSRVRDSIAYYTMTPELTSFVEVPQASDIDITDVAASLRPLPSNLRFKTSHKRTLTVDRGDVESLDESRLIQLFDEIRSTAPLEYIGAVDVAISDYHYDTRGLWEIAEVRTFLRNFQIAHPWVFWYLYLHQNPSHCAGAVMFFRSFGSGEWTGISTADERISWIQLVENGLRTEGERNGSDLSVIVDRLADYATAMEATLR